MNDLILKELMRVCYPPSNPSLGAFTILFQGLSGTTIGHRAKIGMKRMGEIGPKAFKRTCNERFRPEDAEMCSLWHEKLKNPQWHPFRVASKSFHKSASYILQTTTKKHIL